MGIGIAGVIAVPAAFAMLKTVEDNTQEAHASMPHLIINRAQNILTSFARHNHQQDAIDQPQKHLRVRYEHGWSVDHDVII